MIHDLFENVTILVSFLLIIGQIFKNNSFECKQTAKTQILLGAAFGLLGIVLMLFTINITDTVIIDLRNISIMCAGIFGGPISSIIAAVIIALFRVMYFGINNTSIIAHIVALLIGSGIAYISIMKLSRRNKFILMFLFSMIISNAAFLYLIRDEKKLLETLSFYWPVYIFGGVLAYFTSQYILFANSSFKAMLYYRITADNLSDMISTHEPGGIIKFVSYPVQQLFGYTQDEVIGTSAYEYIHPEDIDLVKNIFSNTIQDKDTSTHVFRIRCKDGRYIWVESSIKIIRNADGSLYESICVTRDISIRREFEKELKVSNARFKAIFENAGIGIVVRDKRGKVLEANPAYLEMIEYSKEEVEWLPAAIHPDDCEEVAENFSELTIGNCASCRTEVRFISKNNKTIYTDMTSTLIPDLGHTPVSIVHVINDITERKKTEEKLRESEERFRAAFDRAAIGMCIANMSGKFLKLNLTFCDLLGYSEEELTHMNFIQITHPEDIEKDLSLMKSLMAGEVQQIIFEKRYIRKSGEIVWALLGVSIVYDDEHKPLYLVGQVQDITLRKLAEEKLEKAKLEAEKLASIDFLTGVLNRRAFESRFKEEFNRTYREKSSISIILTDIDYFKEVNDNYGHQVGDITLQKFAQCISNVCRPYDFIGRHGGEEFIICLPNTNCEQAIIIAERMRKAIEDLTINLLDNKQEIRITASFGVSSPIALGEEEDINSLILRADRAMYMAKSRGRNRVTVV